MSIDTSTDVPQITTPVAEPPVMVNFTFLGKTFRAKPVTDGQLVAIAMAKDKEGDVLNATIKVIKSRVGEANWEWMYDQLLDGEVEFTAVAEILTQLMAARKSVTDVAAGA